MDFTPSEEQSAACELAARIFGDLSEPDRLAALGGGTDPALWKALCTAGLVEAVEEIGLLGLVLLLEEQGRTTAQTPFAASCVYGLLAVSAHGTDEQRARLLPGLRDGSSVATGAFDDRGAVRSDPETPQTQAPGGGGAPEGGARGRLTGEVSWAPWLRDATHVLVPDTRRALWWVRTADAVVEPVETTAPWSAGRLILDGTPAERIGPSLSPGPAAPSGAGPSLTEPGAVGAAVAEDPRRLLPGARPEAYEGVLAVARIAFAGLQAGVCAGSLARTVRHTTTREQFGRPLAAHQAVLLRAADAHMDVEAIRVTAYEAAWRHDEGLPHATHALTAAWWASEAGKRVVHTGQHLHGGLGADLDHPVHRHFLWGRQLDGHLGCGSRILAELGALLAAQGEAA